MLLLVTLTAGSVQKAASAHEGHVLQSTKGLFLSDGCDMNAKREMMTPASKVIPTNSSNKMPQIEFVQGTVVHSVNLDSF